MQCVEGWLCGKCVRNIRHPSHWIIRNLYLICDTIKTKQAVFSDCMKHGNNHQPTTLPTTNMINRRKCDKLTDSAAQQPC